MDFYDTEEGEGLWAAWKAAQAEVRFFQARSARLADEGFPRSSREREVARCAWQGASERAHQAQWQLEEASRAFYAR